MFISFYLSPMYETFRTESNLNEQASEKVEKFCIKFSRSVNIALRPIIT